MGTILETVMKILYSKYFKSVNRRSLSFGMKDMERVGVEPSGTAFNFDSTRT
jgi:hypothetical protein